MFVYVFIYIYIYICMRRFVYIYIERERGRGKQRFLFLVNAYSRLRCGSYLVPRGERPLDPKTGYPVVYSSLP